jgi:hypothetical protein
MNSPHDSLIAELEKELADMMGEIKFRGQRQTTIREYLI